MIYNWTDGPELSILLVNANGRDYAAEIAPNFDYDKERDGLYAQTYRDNQVMSWAWDYDRDTAKRDAEQALTALIENDRNEGDKA